MPVGTIGSGVLKFDTTIAPAAAGEIGMNTTSGRPLGNLCEKPHGFNRGMNRTII
jgi:hypothetical protein